VGFAAGQLAVFQGAGSVQNVLQKRAGHGKRLEVTKQPTMKRTTTRTFISIAFVSAKTMEMEVRPLAQSDAVSWKEASRQYRNDLFVHGSTKNKQPAFDLATAQRSLTSNRA
jgi:hypothetical protein